MRRELLKRFGKGLADSSDYYDYYEIYKKNYFLEQIEIEKNDYDLNLFDSDLRNGLARLIHDDSEYTNENLFEATGKLEDDLNKYADTFFGCAYQEYKDYCRESRKNPRERGAISDDNLVRYSHRP